MKGSVRNLVGASLALAVAGCGGGSGDGSFTTGSITFKVVWPETSQASLASSNFGPEIPKAVQTIRLILDSESEDPCCVAIPRGSAAFENRSIVLDDLPPRESSLDFAAFAEAEAPSNGIERTCTVDPVYEASPCSNNQDVPQSFGAGSVAFEIVPGQITNVGDIRVFSLPFVLPMDPVRGGGVEGPDPTISFSVVDATRSVHGVTAELSEGGLPSPLNLNPVGAPRPCSDLDGEDACSANGALEVEGLIFSGNAGQSLVPEQYRVRVRAQNDDTPQRSVDIRYPILVEEGALPLTCSVTFQLVDPVLVGSLRWDTAYAGSGGRFRGDGDDVDCEELATNGQWAFFDNATTSVLGAGYVSLAGSTGPLDVAVCQFEAFTHPAPADFSITVQDATGEDPEFQLDPLPVVRIHGIDCGEGPTTTLGPTTTTTSTTTTSTTATTTSSSTVTSTTASTSSTSSTTSTTMEPTTPCLVRFRLLDDVELGSLQYDTSYSNAPGQFTGTGGDVDCRDLTPEAISTFNDNDAQELLDAGHLSVDGFSGPLDVAECRFAATVSPFAADFDITVTEAATPDLNPVVPLPVVGISSVECDTTCTIEFGVTDSASYGALQFTVDYSAAPGEFDGSGAGVQCTSLIAGSLFAKNDVDSTSQLTLGHVSIDEFTGPTAVAICNFTGVPFADDFDITIDNATDGEGVPLPGATVAVTSIQCQ